jgi:putative N6-adenine-specific DNA methylase
MNNKRLVAIVPRGIEEVTEQELIALGAQDIEKGNGAISFSASSSGPGTQELLYKSNLWLRTASRVLLPIKDFSAPTLPVLYDQVRRIKWEEYLALDRTFALETVVQKNPPHNLKNAQFLSLKIKDAIVDCMRARTGDRPNVNPHQPDVRIHAYFHDKGRCTLSLDSSGRSLHERGYRVEGSLAPLKETLAAALILKTGWKGETDLIDLMCGSGTFLTEAAWIAENRAPGLFKQDFSFQRWKDFDPKLWQKLVSEAESAIKPVHIKLHGFEKNSKTLDSCKKNCARAKVKELVSVVHSDFRSINRPFEGTGLVLANPPYGERLEDAEKLKTLYKEIGDHWKKYFKGWTAYLLTGNLPLLKSVGLQTKKRETVFNGPIECRWVKYPLF